MVGYGESLAKARRPGWESAYIEYGNLKLIVEEVERLYKTLEETPFNSPTASFNDEKEALLEEGMNSLDEAETLEKAAAHSELFLRVLRKQVEKVSLFALSRQGELADAVGSLRFNPYLTGDDGSAMSKDPSFVGEPQKLVIRHDSKGNMKQNGSYGALSNNNSNISEESSIDVSHSPYVDELSFLLPQVSRHISDKGDNSSLRFRESLDTAPRPLFTGKAVLQIKHADSTSPLNLDEFASNRNGYGATSNGVGNKEWMQHDEEKDDKKVPVLDPYTLVGVELLHLLRFICINAMVRMCLLLK